MQEDRRLGAAADALLSTNFFEAEDFPRPTKRGGAEEERIKQVKIFFLSKYPKRGIIRKLLWSVYARHAERSACDSQESRI